MTNAESKMKEIISYQTTADLLDEWELTSNVNTPEVAIVRGLLMDELESRNPEAFNEWLDGEAEDSTLKYYFMD